ncbi:MAG TPA: chemotaxis protein CheW [Xanthomonadaceae bacterium]|jgi:chemotaxis-related protein WspD
MTAALDHCWRRIGVYGGDHSCPMLVETLHCRNCVIFSDAARTLFERASEPEVAEEWQRKESGEHSLRAALVFRLGQQWLGFPPALVAEVAARQPVRRLAHRTTGRLEGVVNVRGELRLCVSLGELLGLGERGEAGVTARMVLVQDSDTRVLAFRCDEVMGLQHFPEGSLQPPPDTLPEPLRQSVEGLFPLAGGHMAMLKGAAIVDLLEQALFA